MSQFTIFFLGTASIKIMVGAGHENITVLGVCNTAGVVPASLIINLGMGIGPYQIHVMESRKMVGHILVFAITIMRIFN